MSPGNGNVSDGPQQLVHQDLSHGGVLVGCLLRCVTAMVIRVPWPRGILA